MEKISVKSLPKDAGESGWQAVLRAKRKHPNLDGRVSAEWAIIGAGFTGLAAARRLKQIADPSQVVVVDAAEVAAGPSGRNAGFMIDVPHNLSSSNYSNNLSNDRDQIEMNRHAIRFATEAIAEFDLDPKLIQPVGKVNAASTKKGARLIEGYVCHLQRLEEDYQIYDEAAMEALTGCAFYQRGVLTPGTSLIQPAGYISAIALSLSKAGVRIFENSPVVELTMCKNGYHIKTPQGQINANKVILCTNGHIASFGYYEKHFLQLFTYASLTRRLTSAELSTFDSHEFWGIIPANPMGTTVRRVSGSLYGGDRILIRNRFTYEPRLEIKDRKLDGIVKDHRNSFVARFPKLADVEFEYTWGGRLCLSLNGGRAYGEIEPNLFSACCQNGLGTVNGTLAGMLIAEEAAGHRSNHMSIHEKFAKQGTPDPLPLSVGIPGAVNLSLKWRETRAGKEL